MFRRVADGDITLVDVHLAVEHWAMEVGVYDHWNIGRIELEISIEDTVERMDEPHSHRAARSFKIVAISSLEVLVQQLLVLPPPSTVCFSLSLSPSIC